MKLASLLILILSLGPVEDGVTRLDAGLTDGLRVGDTGVAFYELTVGSEKKRIELGTVTVLDADATTARCRVPAGAREGHLVEIKIPGQRLETEEVLAALEQSLDPRDYAIEVRRLLDRAVPDDPAIEGQLADLLEARSILRLEPPEGQEQTAFRPPTASPSQPGPAARPERQSVPPAAASAPAAAPPTATATVRPAPSRVSPPAAVAPRPVSPPPGMVAVEAGPYAIGRDLDEARFFSEHPRFRIELAGFWIDQRMVQRREFLEYRPGFRFGDDSDPVYATGLAYELADDYCRSRGRMLPTELQWEVAITEGRARPGLLEWTASWYQPYPGNHVPEKEYGESFRVLRGDADPAAFDAQRRRFAAPTTRHAKLGFRCAKWMAN